MGKWLFQNEKEITVALYFVEESLIQTNVYMLTKMHDRQGPNETTLNGIYILFWKTRVNTLELCKM